MVGFALETEDEVERGKRKLDEKDLDLVIANNPLREGTGFGSDSNAGYLIYRDGRVEEPRAVALRKAKAALVDPTSRP